MSRNLFRLLVVVAGLLLSSCSILNGNIGPFDKDNPEFQSVEGLVTEPSFREGNLPIRTLQVAVVANEWVGEGFTRGVFAEASKLFEEQVGIRFEVTLYPGPKWSTRSFFGIHQALREFRRTHPDYDILFGISLTSDNREAPCFFGSCYAGMIDDERNVALVALSPAIVIHEVGHAFLGIGHSPIGVMRPATEGLYFSVANRKKILKNKWKDFRFYRKEPYEE